MNSLLISFLICVFLINTNVSSVEPSPKKETLSTYIRVDQVRPEFLDQVHYFYDQIIALDKKNEKMSKEFEKKFIDFSITWKTQNTSEQFLAILISRLYVGKIALDHSSSIEDRNRFNETASDLKSIFQ
ncbi:hypothetical protein ACQCN2_16200 [Brevibacillus ginsengisoli]|uniref:hypothetical protein n=1 Tax=Brevibacillus ginsengisoli TaxID=363854 RepID=UPI003CEA0010